MGLTDTLGLGLVLSWKNRMSGEVKRAQRDLRGLEGSAKRVTDRIAKEAERTRAAMQRYRQGMFTSMKIAGAGLAMATPFLLAAKAAAASEQRLANVKSLLVGTGMGAKESNAHIANLKKAIIGMAGTTIVPLNELEDASYKLVSALGAVQGAAALSPAAKLAVAGMGSISDATATLTSILATYGERWGDTMSPMEKSTKIANVLAGTIAAFNTTLPEMSQAMTYVVGPANTLGISLSELSATLGALQTKGLQGTIAGTALGAYIRRLTQLPRFMKTAKAEAALLGPIDFTDAEGRVRPIYDVLAQIEKRFGLTSATIGEKSKELAASNMVGADAFQSLGIEAKYAAALQRIFGDEGSRAIAVLLGQSEALKKQIEQVEHSNALEEMYAERQKTLTAQLIMAGQAFKGIAVIIGSALLPQLKSFASTLKSVLIWVKEFIDQHPTATKWIAWGGLAVGALVAVAGALGTVLYGLLMLKANLALLTLAKAATAAEGAVSAMTVKTLIWNAVVRAAKIAQWAWNTAILASPYVAIAAVVVGAIYLMITHWKKIASVVSTVLGGIWSGVKTLGGWIASGASALVSPIVGAWEGVKTGFNSVINWIVRAYYNVIEWFKTTTREMLAYILNLPGIGAIAKLFDIGGGGSISIGGGGALAATMPMAMATPNITMSTPTVDIPASQAQTIVHKTEYNVNDYSSHRNNLYTPEKADPVEIAKAINKIDQQNRRRAPDGTS